ncbi:hypothetical protein D3C78_1799640 [compost metagenome]
MAKANRIAIVLAVLLQVDAVVQAHQGTGVAAVLRGRQGQLAALAVQVLGVVQAVVMFVIISRREQGTETHLLGQ